MAVSSLNGTLVLLFSLKTKSLAERKTLLENTVDSSMGKVQLEAELCGFKVRKT
jgi:hypothetical protein